jgi:hypothetical protein
MKQQQQHLFFTLCTLVALLSCSILSGTNAATTTTDKTTSEKRQHLRSLLLRGGAASRLDHGGDNQDRDLKSLSLSKYATGEYTSTLDLYQMDTSMSSPNTDVSNAAAVGQPAFDEVMSNGASGQLLYKESGWEFVYALTARGLPPDTAYELVLMTPPTNSDSSSSSVTMTCLGSGMTTLFGALFIPGSAPVESSLVEPTSSNRAMGARVWLALGSEVECSSESAQAQMVAQQPSYAMYLFPKLDEYIEFQYLGDHGQPV